MRLSSDWYKSTTFWIALLAVVGAALGWNSERMEMGQSALIAVLGLLGFGVRNTIAKHGEISAGQNSEMLNSLSDLLHQGSQPRTLQFKGDTYDRPVPVGSEGEGDEETVGNSSGKGEGLRASTGSDADGSPGDDPGEFEGEGDDALNAALNLLVESKNLLQWQQQAGKAFAYVQAVDDLLKLCEAAGWTELDKGDLETEEQMTDWQILAECQAHEASGGDAPLFTGASKCRAAAGQVPTIATDPVPSVPLPFPSPIPGYLPSEYGRSDDEGGES